jgi:hypothetical protein
MTEPKLKADKEAGNLAETTKTMVEEIWLRDNYGYAERVQTDEMLKGILCEQDSMDLAQQVLGGGFRKRYKNNKSNEYISGTPDILVDGVVEDIKTSWSIKTFFNAEMTKLYEYQLRGYMALLGVKEARLIYCLVDTPEEIVAGLKQRVWYKYGQNPESEDYIREAKQIEVNHKYSHIEPSKRVKVFTITHDEAIMDKVYQQVIKCQNYYNTLSL